MSVFHDKLAALGFSSYEDYLAADHWQQFKQQYRKSGRSMKCSVCGAGKIQLHHHTYVRLGEERLDDVTPLCRQHHEAVHQYLKANDVFVEFTWKAIVFLKGDPTTSKPPKKVKKDKGNRKLTSKCNKAVRTIGKILKRNGLHPQSAAMVSAEKALLQGNLDLLYQIKNQLLKEELRKKKNNRSEKIIIVAKIVAQRTTWKSSKITPDGKFNASYRGEEAKQKPLKPKEIRKRKKAKLEAGPKVGVKPKSKPNQPNIEREASALRSFLRISGRVNEICRVDEMLKNSDLTGIIQWLQTLGG